MAANMLINLSIIFYIILVNTRLSASVENCSKKFLDDCEKTECKCLNDTIYCSVDETKLKIVIEPEADSAYLNCNNLPANEFLNLVPHLNIGMTESVYIQGCPLPDNLAIATVLQKLGITNYTYLFNNGSSGISLKRQHFSGLYGLKNLFLLNTHLILSDDVFSDKSLANLTELKIVGSNITLSEDVFNNLSNLHSFFIQGPSNVFLYPRNVLYLNIYLNKLSRITKTSFQSLEQLQLLKISNSGVKEVESNSFDSLKNLNDITLTLNKIIALPANLFKHNKLLRKFELVQYGWHMKEVASKLFANLPNLRSVILKCGLYTIPADLFLNSMNIKTIILARNRLETLPGTLFQSQALIKDIDVSNNRLKFLPQNLLQKTENLENINLSHNQLLKIFGYHFQYIFSLKTLDLSYNNLTFENINLDYKENRDLKSLNLRNNKIEHMPKKLPGYMDELILAYNNITILDVNFSLPKQILDLSSNQIQTIYFDNIIEEYDIYTEFVLNENSIHCDCKLLSFVLFVRGEKRPIKWENLKFQSNNLRCKTPHHLEDKIITQLNPMQLLCPVYGSKGCPIDCNCWERSFDRMLIVNCSNSQLTSVPHLHIIDLKNLTGIELNLENNLIKQLPSTQERLRAYANVTKLFLAGNNIKNVESIHLLRNLTYLDLRRNHLSSLDSLKFTNNSEKLQQILLSSNPWICECSALSLWHYIQSNTSLFKDAQDMICANTPEFKYVYDLKDLCPYEYQVHIIVAIVLFTFGLLLMTFIALYYKYEEELKIWLYARNMCPWFVTEDELDRNKKYDAFISYSSRDVTFISDYLIPELENGSPPFKLCVHERDWLIGEFIPDQIVRSVADSRRTIVVLSQYFIDSVWAKMEFKAAHTSALYEGRSRIIVIVYGEIGDIDRLDKDLRLYLKMNTYLKWGDPNFWAKLRYAMPHSLRVNQ